MSDNKSSLTLSFPTPIWTSSIVDSKKINDLMLKYILDLENKDPNGIKKSNTNGWHSKSFQSFDVANAAIYLAYDNSSYVTGTYLVIDRGWTAI